MRSALYLALFLSSVFGFTKIAMGADERIAVLSGNFVLNKYDCKDDGVSSILIKHSVHIDSPTGKLSILCQKIVFEESGALEVSSDTTIIAELLSGPVHITGRRDGRSALSVVETAKFEATQQWLTKDERRLEKKRQGEYSGTNNSNCKSTSSLDGKCGDKGRDGVDGLKGPNIAISVRKFASGTQLHVVSIGSDGEAGSPGASGYDGAPGFTGAAGRSGRNGTLFSFPSPGASGKQGGRGGNGGAGGDGGRGGKGGNGGDISVLYYATSFSEARDVSFNLLSRAGNPGSGGQGGKAGVGGAGGFGGRGGTPGRAFAQGTIFESGSAYQRAGARGRTGVRGLDGANGHQGHLGSSGDVGFTFWGIEQTDVASIVDRLSRE